MRLDINLKGARVIVEKPQRVVSLVNVGRPGPPGPQGPPGASGATYVHTQATPLAVWTVNHNLGFRPSVEVTTTGGLEFEAEILHTSLNSTTITLLVSMTGTARFT